MKGIPGGQEIRNCFDKRKSNVIQDTINLFDGQVLIYGGTQVDHDKAIKKAVGGTIIIPYKSKRGE